MSDFSSITTRDVSSIQSAGNSNLPDAPFDALLARNSEQAAQESAASERSSAVPATADPEPLEQASPTQHESSSSIRAEDVEDQSSRSSDQPTGRQQSNDQQTGQQHRSPVVSAPSASAPLSPSPSTPSPDSAGASSSAGQAGGVERIGLGDEIPVKEIVLADGTKVSGILKKTTDKTLVVTLHNPADAEGETLGDTQDPGQKIPLYALGDYLFCVNVFADGRSGLPSTDVAYSNLKVEGDLQGKKLAVINLSAKEGTDAAPIIGVEMLEQRSWSQAAALTLAKGVVGAMILHQRLDYIGAAARQKFLEGYMALGQRLSNAFSGRSQEDLAEERAKLNAALWEKVGDGKTPYARTQEDTIDNKTATGVALIGDLMLARVGGGKGAGAAETAPAPVLPKAPPFTLQPITLGPPIAALATTAVPALSTTLALPLITSLARQNPAAPMRSDNKGEGAQRPPAYADKPTGGTESPQEQPGQLQRQPPGTGTQGSNAKPAGKGSSAQRPLRPPGTGGQPPSLPESIGGASTSAIAKVVTAVAGAGMGLATQKIYNTVSLSGRAQREASIRTVLQRVQTGAYSEIINGEERLDRNLMRKDADALSAYSGIVFSNSMDRASAALRAAAVADAPGQFLAQARKEIEEYLGIDKAQEKRTRIMSSMEQELGGYGGILSSDYFYNAQSTAARNTLESDLKRFRKLPLSANTSRPIINLMEEALHWWHEDYPHPKTVASITELKARLTTLYGNIKQEDTEERQRLFTLLEASSTSAPLETVEKRRDAGRRLLKELGNKTYINLDGSLESQDIAEAKRLIEVDIKRVIDLAHRMPEVKRLGLRWNLERVARQLISVHDALSSGIKSSYLQELSNLESVLQNILEVGLNQASTHSADELNLGEQTFKPNDLSRARLLVVANNLNITQYYGASQNFSYDTVRDVIGRAAKGSSDMATELTDALQEDIQQVRRIFQIYRLPKSILLKLQEAVDLLSQAADRANGLSRPGERERDYDFIALCICHAKEALVSGISGIIN